jgi:hypothetical protein
MSYSFKTRAPMKAEVPLEAICAATTVSATAAATVAAATAAAAAAAAVKGYVPPSQRAATQKPVAEEFPTLGMATVATAGVKRTLKFSDMFKDTAAAATATAAAAATATAAPDVALARPGLRVVDCPLPAGLEDDEPESYVPRHSVFLQRVAARQVATARRRRKIFDSASEDDLEEVPETEEVPDEDSWNDDDSGHSQEGGEEGAEAYDASAFDRHR